MWLTEENRDKCFWHSFIPGFISLFLAIGFAIGNAYDSKTDTFTWDFYKIGAIICGGLLGSIIRYIIIYSLWF